MVNVFARVCLHGFLFSFSHFGNRPSRRRDDGRLARCLSRLRRLGGPGVFSCSQNGMSWAKRGYAGIGFTTIRDVMRRFGFELSHTQTMDILNHLEIVVFFASTSIFLCWSDSHLLLKVLVLFVVWFDTRIVDGFTTITRSHEISEPYLHFCAKWYPLVN